MEYTNMDIKRQINNLIYLNVISFSVLSGSGNCSMPDSQDLEELESMLQGIAVEQRPYNIYFTDSLYKKCMPQYEIDIENPYNFYNFQWISKKRKKLIDIDVMTSSIIACCNLAERLLTFDLQLENPSLIIYLLQKTASNQAWFIMQYLKVGDMFYNGEDVAKQNSQEPNIQIASNSPSRASQFAVFHAFSALLQLSRYNLYNFSCHEEKLLESLNLLPNMLTAFAEEIEDCSSKELSLIGQHIAEIYKTSEFYCENCRKILSKITRELCQRIGSEGEVYGSKDSNEASSVITASHSLNLLSQYAYMFSSKSCFEASHKIFQSFSNLWDDEGKIFKLKDSNKQSYSIKSVAAILAALFSYSKVVHDIESKEGLHKQIFSFANTVLIKSGIFIGQYYPILQSAKLEPPEPRKDKTPWAPVLNKAFEYKISKGKYYCDADVFRADYVMPACAILLEAINN